MKSISEATVKRGLLPTQAIGEVEGLLPDEETRRVIEEMIDPKLDGFSVVVNSTPNWPSKLEDAERPTPLLYYRGDLGLLESKSVSVVGAREASEAGRKRARRLSSELADRGITVVTGVARGIDAEATKSATESGGRTIGVIGTPIDEAYPPENKQLQDTIAHDHLLVSQVPFYRYKKEPFKSHRYRFPERNELMAAISNATVIVEASDRSGTLTQARSCLHQRRPLFLMRSLFDNDSITWPRKYAEKEGVHILDSVDQIDEAINAVA